MRLYVIVFVILISTYVVNASLLEPVVKNVVHYEATHPPNDVQGIWRKKTIWKPRWVKEWKSSKVTKPVWRKIWSPVHIKEWVPIPKPPPGWDTKSTHLVPVKTATDKIPFWDPMPYPESQQPPPPSSQNNDNQCGVNGCDDILIQTFTQEQIAKIIGSHRHKKAPEHYQSEDHTDSTMTEFMTVPTNLESWRLPRQSHFHDNRYNFQQEPSQYLVPPKLQSFVSDFFFYLKNQKNVLPQQSHNPSTVKPQSSQIPTNHLNSITTFGVNQWTPIQNRTTANHQNLKNNKPTNLASQFQNSNRGHRPGENQSANFKKQNININQPAKDQNTQNHQAITKPNLHGNSDFIQQADLIGEYHYSDFDLYSTVKPIINLQQEPKFKPLPSLINNQSLVSMTFKHLPKETSPKLLQEMLENSRVKPTALPKFRPLPTETTLPKAVERIKQIKPQSQPLNSTKLRQIRKDAETFYQENDVEKFTPKPEIIFQQEKAITKEILPLQISTPHPFPTSHRFGPGPVFKPSNNSRPTNFDQINNVEKNFHLYFVYPEEKKHSEENLLNALKKIPTTQVKKNNTTEFQVEQTTQFPVSTTTSALTDSKMEVTTKSPVFIVTPTYVQKS